MSWPSAKAYQETWTWDSNVMDCVSIIKALSVLMFLGSGTLGAAEAWRDCIPNSIGPGGCDSIAPGGGNSIAPGGGLSIGPGGGLSIGPGGGQSSGPGGGQSIAPGGGKAYDRDRSRGLDPDTMHPYPQHGIQPLPSSSITNHSPQSEGEDESEEDGYPFPLGYEPAMPIVVNHPPPKAPDINYSQFDAFLQTLERSTDKESFTRAYAASQAEAERIISVRREFIERSIDYQYPEDPQRSAKSQQAVGSDPEIAELRQRLASSASSARRRITAAP